MLEPIRRVVVLGGGSAGFLTALSFKRFLPELEIVVVHAPNIPVIGVGESTTRAVSLYLHDVLGIDRGQFFKEVQPSWKLGLRMEWGDPADTHFNYPFDAGMGADIPGLSKLCSFYCQQDMTDGSLFSGLMDQAKSCCVQMEGRIGIDDRFAYHIRNESFIDFLQRAAVKEGAQTIEGEVVKAEQAESGDVQHLLLADGRKIAGDFFIDCSGFRSELLAKTMQENYFSYSDRLFCDAAIVGSWERDDQVLPYTTVETMNHGWCWRIDFLDVVARGYVFSTQFCSPDEAMREMKEKNPQLGDDLRLLKFPCGRYENYWVRNVAAIGNSCGFVEPLEATALHLIIEQIRLLKQSFSDSGCRIVPAMQKLENERFRRMWDDVRDFLALHYRFNRRLDTPFWQHCRADTLLGGAEELVEYYRQAGPSGLASALIYKGSIFGYSGYMAMLLGQRVPTSSNFVPSEQEREIWERYRQTIRMNVKRALPVKEALQAVFDPAFQWPKRK